MNFNWSKILDGLINAKYDFTKFLTKFKAMFTATVEEADVAALLDMAKASLASVLNYLPYILLALCVIEVFFGKKLFGIQKFLLMFGLGFIGGVLIVAPIVDKFIVLPTYVTGAVVGLICAILCKLLYWLCYVAVFGYSVYMVCFAGVYLAAVTQYTKGILLYSAIAAGVVIIIALLLRKFIEMLATSALGAFGIVSIVISDFYDFTALVPGSEAIVKLAAIGVITLIGFIVQVKTRRRYY